MIGELLGLSLFKPIAMILLATTIAGGGFSFVQTKRLHSYQNENAILKQKLNDSQNDVVDMINLIKAGEPQIEILKKHERKLLEACKDQIRKMDIIEETP